MAMTLQQILDEIQEKYPHGFSNDSIIRKINQIQAELFRTIYRPITQTFYDLLADNPYYPLDFSSSKVVDVVVNGCEYPFRHVKGKDLSKYYYFTDDQTLAIFPTPTEDITDGLMVVHYKEPRTLTTSDLSLAPDFDPDYHMLLVYLVCKQLAENAKEYDVANGFAVQANQMLQSFEQGTETPDFTTIQDVYGGCLLL